MPLIHGTNLNGKSTIAPRGFRLSSYDAVMRTHRPYCWASIGANWICSDGHSYRPDGFMTDPTQWAFALKRNTVKTCR